MKKNEALSTGKAISLLDHIQYSGEAIVSKTLASKKAGSITLFAFDKGQELSEHTAPFDAIVQILEGEAELVIGGNPVVVSAGQIAIMPANVAHAVKAGKRFKMLLTMISRDKQS